MLGRNDKLLGPSSSFFSCASYFYVSYFIFLAMNVSCAYVVIFSFFNLLLFVFVLFTTCVSCAHASCFWFLCVS